MCKRETCFRTPCNMVFNTIQRYFRYDITPYSDDNKCYRRSQSRLTGGVVLDEIVAFATGFGSSTHHTQSPKPRLNQPQPQSNNIIFTHPNPTPTPTPLHSILFTSLLKHSIYLYPDAYTFTLNVNKLLTLHISLDILTII